MTSASARGDLELSSTHLPGRYANAAGEGGEALGCAMAPSGATDVPRKSLFRHEVAATRSVADALTITRLRRSRFCACARNR